MKAILSLLLCLILLLQPACVTAKGEWGSATAVMTNASRFKANKDGVDITDLNQVEGAKVVAGLIQKMWSGYLTGAAIKYAMGKYYDFKGTEISSAQTVKLEELKNAKSLADGELALKAAEEARLAEAAAAGAAAGG